MSPTRYHRAGRFLTKWAGVFAWVFLVLLAAVVFQVQQDQHASDRRQTITNARNFDAGKVKGCENANLFRSFFPDVIRFAAAQQGKGTPEQVEEFIAEYREQFPLADCKALDAKLTRARVARFGEGGR